jgi:Ca-activated chloride channel family protein
MSTKHKFLLLILGIGIAVSMGACGPAPMDASKARSRHLINQGVIVPAEEVRVLEYLNYYEQHFSAPTEASLGLDLRLGNEQIPASGGEVWLQIGLQAQEMEQAGDVAPLNLALVIDRSGSMDAPDKWPYLQQSLRVFFRSLDPDDIVAVIGYDDQAEVVLPAQRAGDRSWIESTVACLYPRGATNLHAGMMLGFQEVDKHFDIRRNNRVILMTDGIANRGVTDPDQIAADALRYNERGIYLSTVGLGLEYNDALLSKLARQGKGSYHFIDSAEEMDKVFCREVTGLLEKAASEVAVTVYPSAGVELVGVTGCDGRPPDGPVQIPLQDMGTGDNQVLLVQLQVGPGRGMTRSVATVTLDYSDIFAQRPVQVTQEVTATTGAGTDYDPLWDLELLRNVTIQRTAEGLKEIDRLYQARRYAEAWSLAFDLELSLREVARLTGDEAMIKDADLMQLYQNTLAEQIRYEGGQLPQPTPSRTQRPYRGYEATPVPTIQILETR